MKNKIQIPCAARKWIGIGCSGLAVAALVMSFASTSNAVAGTGTSMEAQPVEPSLTDSRKHALYELDARHVSKSDPCRYEPAATGCRNGTVPYTAKMMVPDNGGSLSDANLCKTGQNNIAVGSKDAGHRGRLVACLPPQGGTVFQLNEIVTPDANHGMQTKSSVTFGTARSGYSRVWIVNKKGLKSYPPSGYYWQPSSTDDSYKP